jgi:hypothetical protein
MDNVKSFWRRNNAFAPRAVFPWEYIVVSSGRKDSTIVRVHIYNEGIVGTQFLAAVEDPHQLSSIRGEGYMPADF